MSEEARIGGVSASQRDSFTFKLWCSPADLAGVRVLLAFGLVMVLSIAAPAWGQVGLLDDVVDRTTDAVDGTIQTIDDLDTGVEIIDDTVDTTVDVVDGVVDDVVGTGDETADPEPGPEPELPPGEPQPTTTTQPDRTQAITDDRDEDMRLEDGGDADRGSLPADLSAPLATTERTDDSENEGAAAVASRDFDDPFDIFAVDRLLTAATTGSASTLFDRALDWLTSSGSLLGILAGPLLALQILLRALLSAGSGLVAPASLLAAVVAASLYERRRPRAAAS